MIIKVIKADKDSIWYPYLGKTFKVCEILMLGFVIQMHGEKWHIFKEDVEVLTP